MFTVTQIECRLKLNKLNFMWLKFQVLFTLSQYRNSV